MQRPLSPLPKKRVLLSSPLLSLMPAATWMKYGCIFHVSGGAHSRASSKPSSAAAASLPRRAVRVVPCPPLGPRFVGCMKKYANMSCHVSIQTTEPRNKVSSRLRDLDPLQLPWITQPGAHSLAQRCTLKYASL